MIGVPVRHEADSIAFALAGMVFGLLAGWVIGAQYATTRAGAAAAAAPRRRRAAAGRSRRAAAAERGRRRAVPELAEAEPTERGAAHRAGQPLLRRRALQRRRRVVQSGDEARRRNADVSTDLGVSYYYLNQPDLALEQFEHSLSVNPKHTKTMLNLGIVRAFGKQDLDGASKAWQEVVDIAPQSPEGQAARRALDAMQNGAPRRPRPSAGHVSDDPMGWLIRVILFSLLLTLVVRAVLRLFAGIVEGASGRPARAGAAEHEDGEGPCLRHLRRPQRGPDRLARQQTAWFCSPECQHAWQRAMSARMADVSLDQLKADIVEVGRRLYARGLRRQQRRQHHRPLCRRIGC